MILEEFDQATEAIINPWDVVKKQPGFPKVGVSCFASVTFDRMLQELGGQIIARSNMANESISIYRVGWDTGARNWRCLRRMWVRRAVWACWRMCLRWGWYERNLQQYMR